MPYLLKTEPDSYSFANLERDRETVWDGVANPVAIKHLREMKAGDQLVIYHTGKERQAVGTAKVISAENGVVRIRSGSPVVHPKTLASIKEHKLFSDSPLVNQGRLSVVPLTQAQYDWLNGTH